MLIPCPYCGPRIHEEFTYLGDATVRRPDPTQPGAEDAFFDYVYLRDNPAGRHEELWFHAAGCHAWIVVERDTRNHVIFGARPAKAAASVGSDGVAP